jgi:hypothetical protein
VLRIACGIERNRGTKIRPRKQGHLVHAKEASHDLEILEILLHANLGGISHGIGAPTAAELIEDAGVSGRQRLKVGRSRCGIRDQNRRGTSHNALIIQAHVSGNRTEAFVSQHQVLQRQHPS